MTMTKTPRDDDNDDTKPPQPSPNPKSKKKNKERTYDESSEEKDEVEDEIFNNDPQVVDLVSRFDREALSGTPQLWTQPIVPPTVNWKNVRIEGEVTGFSPDEVFGEGESVHVLSRLGKIIRGLDARTSLSASGWSTLFEEVFTKQTLQAHHELSRIEQLKRFGIRLALSNPMYTFDSCVWVGSALRAREDTNAWTGAYLFFGAPWNMKKVQHFGTTEIVTDTLEDRAVPVNTDDDSDDPRAVEGPADTDSDTPDTVMTDVPTLATTTPFSTTTFTEPDKPTGTNKLTTWLKTPRNPVRRAPRNPWHSCKTFSCLSRRRFPKSYQKTSLKLKYAHLLLSSRSDYPKCNS